MYCFCAMLLCACSSKTSCADQNLDIEKTMEYVEERIIDETWKMGFLNQTPLHLEDIQALYGEIVEHCDEYMVKQALIDVACGEVAIFHVTDGALDTVIEACEQRKQALLKAYASLPYQADIAGKAQIIENKGYVFFVMGEDVDSLIAYFHTL